jgi:diaminopimelate dehydrogenase
MPRHDDAGPGASKDITGLYSITFAEWEKSSMKAMRLAIVGFGKLGRACVEAIRADEQSQLAGIVRQQEHAFQALPAGFENVRVAGHVSELGQVDAALLCVPAEEVLGVAHDLLQSGIPVVECATLHGKAFLEHKKELDRMAALFKVPAVVGAGWDPGMLSVFREIFALLTPKGKSEITHRPGLNLHHTTLAQAIPGVRGALSTELRTADGRRQHYVYVEVKKDASFEAVEAAITNDPQFIEDDTFVFPVDSIAMLEEEGHGVLLERRGAAGAVDHQLFLLEGRYSERALAAQVMIAAARAVSNHGHRAYSLLDLPLGSLWGELRAMAEQEWM